ncbi:1-acylglycerol-3-phosphate O-acyltransferase [Mortierella sp. GBA35]|nr:1-acylglycerol-3-phosphate O-acyltransferase [Mortierella sp. AD031]KAF9101202.1 1-acylglycerol-3-phosphate O-acyltransferase [Mortierella sp. GBA35]KAG0208570.1 1-acylglycerol-3-phosphate O-acyltransferase [Mortierella sp. NVP41]
MSIVSYLQAAIVIPLFYYFALPQILAVLPKKAQFLAKCIVVLLATLVMSVAGCFISIACAIANKRYIINYVVSRLFGILASRACGVTVKVIGKENLDKTPAIVVCNHQSSMDMMVLGSVFPKHTVVMAKKELLYFPFLGVFMKLSNAIFIDRKNHKKAIESTTQAVADMKKHNSGIWIFPEGTRSRLDKADLLPFKKGAFHLAIQAQLPILPIISEGYSHIYDSSKRSFPGGELEIRVLEPIPTTGLTADDVNDLMEKTRNLMLKHLQEMDHSASATTTAKSDASAKPVQAIIDSGKTTATSVAPDQDEASVKKRRTLKD